MSRTDYPLFIVDDECTVLESLAFMLESYGFDIQTFSDGRAFLDQVDSDQVGTVLLDSRMPGLRGQEVHQILNQMHSPLSVIFLTGHGDIPMAVDALKEGAQDFFQKPVNGDQLVTAIDAAMQISEQNKLSATKRKMLGALTKREREILDLILKGCKNQQMADVLCVSLRTIEVHRSNLMKKMGVTSVAALIKNIGHLV